jgi:hypothetical protein
MTDHQVGSRAEWLAAREKLLEREKEHTHLRPRRIARVDTGREGQVDRSVCLAPAIRLPSACRLVMHW